MRKLTSGLLLTGLMTLAGCSSNSSHEQQLALLAQNRAGVISAELPLESGPLSIMRAKATANVITIMMIYNHDAQGAKPIEDVMKQSIKSYCSQAEIRSNLDLGLVYRIEMRNARGKLMVDQVISKQTCQ
jgi:hypothetical protein